MANRSLPMDPSLCGGNRVSAGLFAAEPPYPSIINSSSVIVNDKRR